MKNITKKWLSPFAITLLGAIVLNTAQAAGKNTGAQYLKNKSNLAISRINQQLPKHAKLSKHQKQRIKIIVTNHQKRLKPLKQDLSLTNKILRHYGFNKHKNHQKIQRVNTQRRQLNTRIASVRQHQREQINRVLEPKQIFYLQKVKHQKGQLGQR